MRQHGHVWTATCVHCGKPSDPWQKLGGERWQEERPAEPPPHAGECCEAVYSQGAAKVARWEHFLVPEPTAPRGRQSAFSWSDTDFTPHFNTAFGRRVGSLDEMKALQASSGTEDAVVKGDAERFVPRDLDTIAKRSNDLAEGRPVERDGVRVEFKDGE